MKINKFIHIFLMSTVALAMSACVPKATEKKAVCGTNEAFSSVTRSCYSVVESRYIPVATKSSDTLTQETAKTITLSYTDANKNQALSCKVSGQSANIEAVSPQLISGNIFSKADQVFFAAQDAASALPLAPRATALLERDAMTAALNIARTSFNYSVITGQLGLFRTAALNILSIASGYTGSSIAIQYYYTQTQSKLTDYDAAKVFVDNRCDCAGGICTTSIAPKMHKSGAAGFNYTITDMDGESAPKGVSLTIAAMSGSTNFLKPAVESTYITGVESDSNIPSQYAFVLGTARDYSGTTSFTYAHNKTVGSVFFPTLGLTKSYVASDSGLGKITNCLGLGGSLTTDTSCVYIPNSGDGFSALAPAKATVTMNTDLTITAKARGVAGNNISIVFKDITDDLTALDSALSTSTEKYGLVGSFDDIYIRVIGDTINVVFNDNVTTTLEIANALNADLVAKTLVDASAGGIATKALVASAASGVSLAGGIGGYDTFSYTVSNGVATSTNTATATIQITTNPDNPVWNPYPSTSSALTAIDATATSHLEGAAALSMTTNVSSTYYDPDDVATTCVVSTDPLDLILWSSGSNGLAGVTVAEVTKTDTDFGQIILTRPTCTISGVAPTKIITFDVDRTDLTKANAFGTYALLFKINNGAALTTSLPTFQAYKFTVTPVNDAPELTAINWTASTTNPVTTTTGATLNVTLNENSTTTPSTAYADITIDPDDTGTGFETAQTMTVTASSDDQALLKDANISVTTLTATTRRVSFTTEKDRSGTANITLTIQDNGGTTNAGVDTATATIALTVTMVDDAPYVFSSFTTVDTNEGGLVQSPGFEIEEDMGRSPDEDTQDISITSISSDNTTVLPNSAVTIFYDQNDNGVEDALESRATTVAFETTEDDVGLHKFYLKLKPVAGVSGNANVTLTISDGLNSITQMFSLIVHPVAALHGGWANISAVGIKTDKTGTPVSESDIQCNYNKSIDIRACDTNQSCTSTSAPHGVVTPDAANVIYWDSGSKKCYRSTSTSKFSWVDVTTSCPVTRIFVAPTTLSTAINSVMVASMSVASTTGFPAAGTVTIGSEQIAYTSKTSTTFVGLTRGVNSTTAVAHAATDSISYTANGENFFKTGVATPVPTAQDQYYFDTTTKQCFSSNEAVAGIWSWNATAYVPSKITLAWNSFTVTGSGPDSGVQVYGWNIYRRVAGKDYDFVAGYLKKNASDTMSISDATTKTFTDTTAVAGKVYYYLVRPVDSTARKLTISTPDIFSEVRIFAPPENYAFVHRWMVNQEVCGSMHMTTTSAIKSDPTRNYRCPFKGPGESSTAVGYYDIGKDMLVDISESGCPYTPAPACSANGCIGIGNPHLSVGATANDIYYDRSTGACYLSTGGISWVSFLNFSAQAPADQIILAAKTNTALNAPLTNITQTQATNICAQRTLTVPGLTSGTLTATLPSKKEFIAYSASPYNMTDSLVTDLEQGFSLNVQSRCNSSSANGLEAAYSDSTIPSTSYIYSTPGTSSSGIRSIYTGSVPWVNNYSTETCSSRYGIQDVYGNVAEWVKDKMTCNGANPSALTTTLTADTTPSLTTALTVEAHSSGATVALVTTSLATPLTVSSTVGATTLKALTAGYPGSGILQIGNEVASFTVLDPNTFTVSALTYAHTVGAGVDVSLVTGTGISTTLSASIASGVTSVPIASMTGFVAPGKVVIENEYTTFSAVTGATSLPVASTVGFPATGSVTVGSETLAYSAVGANSITLSASSGFLHSSGSAVSLVISPTNFVCTSDTTTDLGDYDISTGTYPGGTPANRYKFDLSTGPYNDIDATTTTSTGDGFLTNWDFRDELFGAGKFNFPLGMPIYVDIGSMLPTSPALPYFLDIGPTAGITTSQLHEDGIIVNGAAVRNDFSVGHAANPNNYLDNSISGKKGSFAQGGSYLSGNRSGRYSSELIPDVNMGPDVGFRCYIDVPKAEYPADANHPYSAY